MKAFILLALIASATAVPFLEKFSLIREELMRVKAAAIDTTTQGFEPGMAVSTTQGFEPGMEDTTTEGFSPYKKEDMNAPEHMVGNDDIVSRRFQILRQIANRKAEVAALEVEEDMNAPEFMVWKLDDEIEDINTPEILEVGSRRFQILRQIANRKAEEAALETTTIDFSPWEIKEEMNAPEFMAIPAEIPTRRDEIFGRLEKMLNERSRH